MDPLDKVTVEQRLAAIEAKLDAVLARLGMAEVGTGPQPGPYGAVVDAVAVGDVEALVRAGKRIQAIKVYRERTGVGLREAKDAVDRLAAEQRKARYGF